MGLIIHCRESRSIVEGSVPKITTFGPCLNNQENTLCANHMWLNSILIGLSTRTMFPCFENQHFLASFFTRILIISATLHKHYYFVDDYDLLIPRSSCLHECSCFFTLGRHSKHSDTNMLKTSVLLTLYRRHAEAVISVKNYGPQNPVLFFTGKAKASGVKEILLD